MDSKMNSRKMLAKIQEKRMHVSFVTRKGLCGWFTPVSWLASQDASLRPASSCYKRPSQDRFFDPSDRLRCPRLQLRGSAGFAPASHSTGVRPGLRSCANLILRKSKTAAQQIYRPRITKSNAREIKRRQPRLHPDCRAAGNIAYL